jgi:hypothetical protein
MILVRTAFVAAAVSFLASTTPEPAQAGDVTALRAPPQAYSAQERRRPRPQIRVQPDQPAAYDYPRPGPYAWPGPGAVRECVDWYATEYRPSGVVMTPQMRCRWVRR